MASVKQGHEVQRWAKARGCRVLFMGDVDQNVSVEAGDHFRILLKASPVHTATLEEIIRQKPESLDGHYLQAVKLFKAGKTTEAFSELHQAGRIRELRGQDRVEAFAQAIVRSEEEGRPAIATCATHRENDAIAEAVRRRWHEQSRQGQRQKGTQRQTTHGGDVAQPTGEAAMADLPGAVPVASKVHSF